MLLESEINELSFCTKHGKIFQNAIYQVDGKEYFKTLEKAKAQRASNENDFFIWILPRLKKGVKNKTEETKEKYLRPQKGHYDFLLHKSISLSK